MAEGYAPHRAVRRLHSKDKMPTRLHVQANECGKIGEQHHARQSLPPDDNQLSYSRPCGPLPVPRLMQPPTRRR